LNENKKFAFVMNYVCQGKPRQAKYPQLRASPSSFHAFVRKKVRHAKPELARKFSTQKPNF
jgi:hypothetical protein